MKIFVLIALLLLFLPQIYATSPTSVFHDDGICMKEQGVEIPLFYFITEEGMNLSHSIDLSCAQDVKEKRYSSIEECRDSIHPDAVFMFPNQRPCDFASDYQACYNCLERLEREYEQERINHKIENYTMSVVLGSIFICFGFLIVQGSYFVFKRKLLGSRRLLIGVITTFFVLLLILILYFVFSRTVSL